MRANSGRLAFIATLGILVASATAHAERIRLFEQSNFAGWNRVFLGDQPSLFRGGSPHPIRSIRILSGSWLLCAEIDFAGDCLWVSRDLRDLSDVGFDKPVLSAKPQRVVVTRYRWGGRPRPYRSIVFFAKENFDGPWIAHSKEDAQLAIGPGTPSPQSIVVQDGIWQLCSYPHFAGRCLTVTGDVRDLRSIFPDTILSLRRIGSRPFLKAPVMSGPRDSAQEPLASAKLLVEAGNEFH